MFFCISSTTRCGSNTMKLNDVWKIFNYISEAKKVQNGLGIFGYFRRHVVLMNGCFYDSASLPGECFTPRCIQLSQESMEGKG